MQTSYSSFDFQPMVLIFWQSKEIRFLVCVRLMINFVFSCFSWKVQRNSFIHLDIMKLLTLKVSWLIVEINEKGNGRRKMMNIWYNFQVLLSVVIFGTNENRCDIASDNLILKTRLGNDSLNVLFSKTLETISGFFDIFILASKNLRNILCRIFKKPKIEKENQD